MFTFLVFFIVFYYTKTYFSLIIINLNTSIWENAQKWYGKSRILEFGNYHPGFPNYINIFRATSTPTYQSLSDFVPVGFAVVGAEIEAASGVSLPFQHQLNLFTDSNVG